MSHFGSFNALITKHLKSAKSDSNFRQRSQSLSITKISVTKTQYISNNNVRQHAQSLSFTKNCLFIKLPNSNRSSVVSNSSESSSSGSSPSPRAINDDITSNLQKIYNKIDSEDEIKPNEDNYKMGINDLVCGDSNSTIDNKLIDDNNFDNNFKSEYEFKRTICKTQHVKKFYAIHTKYDNKVVIIKQAHMDLVNNKIDIYNHKTYENIKNENIKNEKNILEKITNRDKDNLEKIITNWSKIYSLQIPTDLTQLVHLYIPFNHGIVRYYDYFQDNEKKCINLVMPNYGSRLFKIWYKLHQCWHQRNEINTEIYAKIVQSWCKSVAKSVSTLHEYDIACLNLTMESFAIKHINFKQFCDINIIDLGFALDITNQSNKLKNGKCFDYIPILKTYKSPEMTECGRNYGNFNGYNPKKVDIFSLGRLFESLNERLENNDCHDLVRHMLVNEQDKRYDINQVMNHSYIAQAKSFSELGININLLKRSGRLQVIRLS